MNDLTSKQRAHLRKLAHRLKPVVFVGNEGVTEAVVSSILDALNTRELLKIKLQESAPLGVRDAATELSERIDGAHIAQTIGKTIVLYRADPETPEIRLPAAGARSA
ncbi:MAG: YhbY family RNA-binding protein [Gemmatimonadota bacterium]